MNKYTNFNSGFISGYADGYADQLKKNIENNIKNDNFNIERNFKLKKQDDKDEFEYKPEKKLFSFYQICKFPINKNYHVKKIIYNEYGEIQYIKETTLKKYRLKKFVKKCPKHKYLIYPSFNFENIPLPQNSDICIAQSQILNDNIT